MSSIKSIDSLSGSEASPAAYMSLATEMRQLDTGWVLAN